MNHEMILIHQQREMLVVFFYIVYLFEYFIGLIKLKNDYLAYKNLSFEREAFDNEDNQNYLDKRKWFSSFKYYKNN